MASRIGMIGLDTSHVSAFAKLLNNASDPEHVPGGKVVAAFPGGSKDFDLSINRVAGFTQELREKYAVQIMESPEAVAEAVDLVFIESVDGRAHRELFERTAKFKKPTFIDKPFTTSSEDAKAIFRIAGEAGIPVMSASSLRYADSLTRALASGKELGSITGCDIYGPMDIITALPGLFWYGIHAVEILVTIMGTGCREVRATHTDLADVIAFTWSDGRMASIRGNRKAHSQFGASIHREKNVQQVNLNANTKSYYASLLEAIMNSLPQGKSDIPQEQTLEIVRLIEAANESRASGQAVKV